MVARAAAVRNFAMGTSEIYPKWTRGIIRRIEITTIHEKVATETTIEAGIVVLEENV